MRLIYNATSRQTISPPGVQIRVGGFGTTESVEFVDPAKVIGTGYFDALVKQLVSFGYERNVNIFGAPYDFRKAPNELGEYFKDLKKLIERAYKSNGDEKVSLICHSMGCYNSLHFLNQNTQAWKDKYIRSMISLSGVWGGSVKAMKAFASGDNFGVIVIPSLSLRRDFRTFPSLAYLLPSKHVWPEDKVFLEHQDKKYTVNDYEQFFHDINYPTGYQMWLDTKNLTSPLNPPGVEVHCLHGNGVNTIDSLKYTSTDFPDGKPKITYGDGDGTVNLVSLQACINWSKQQQHPIYYKNFKLIDHMTIMSDNQVLYYIGNALSKLT